jgi:hypothetical protein
MIHQAAPPPSPRTPTLAANWGTALVLIWGLLWPIGASLTAVAYAQTGSQVPANHPVLTQAKHFLDEEKAEEAIALLRRFLATSPKPEFLDDIYLLPVSYTHLTLPTKLL